MTEEPDPLFRYRGQVLGPSVEEEGMQEDDIPGLSGYFCYIEIDT